MTDTAITITAVLGFLAGAATACMWLGPALSRVRTERYRLQSVVDSLRAESEAMTDKIAQLTADCVELQDLAHEAQDLAAKESLERRIESYKLAHTKRKLAAARGQITKLKRRIEG